MNGNRSRIVVLISGTGASLQAVLDAGRWQTLDAEVVGVFSHEPWSYGLIRAEREGIPALLHDLTDYRVTGRSEREYSMDLADRVGALRPDLVLMAGWKIPLTDAFFQRFAGRTVNLYAGTPGQPQLFDPYARNPVSRAYEAFSAGLIRHMDVAIQLVDNARADVVRTVSIKQVPIYDFDTLVDLEERAQRTERELLINTLQLLLRDRKQQVGSGR